MITRSKIQYTSWMKVFNLKQKVEKVKRRSPVAAIDALGISLQAIVTITITAKIKYFSAAVLGKRGAYNWKNLNNQQMCSRSCIGSIAMLLSASGPPETIR